MKHNAKITLILISMFFITQLIGLTVIYLYAPVQQEVMVNGTLQNVTVHPLPYGMEPPSMDADVSLFSIIVSFVLAIVFVFFLTKFKVDWFIKLWFFTVVVIVLGITFNAFLSKFIIYSQIVSLIIALPLAVYKVFKRNIYVHNFTELLIYPGIAVVFIPILNIWTLIILLLGISVYDIWAVWHSGFMQKMAKYQINNLKVFAGFYVPYLNKKQRQIIKEAKISNKKGKIKSMKVNLAILGGGDVVFPIIASGVIFRMFGLIPALIVVVCSTLALSSLFVFAKKGKFYPAMPFLTAGLLIGITLAFLYSLII